MEWTQILHFVWEDWKVEEVSPQVSVWHACPFCSLVRVITTRNKILARLPEGSCNDHILLFLRWWQKLWDNWVPKPYCSQTRHIPNIRGVNLKMKQTLQLWQPECQHFYPCSMIISCLPKYNSLQPSVKSF